MTDHPADATATPDTPDAAASAVSTGTPLPPPSVQPTSRNIPDLDLHLFNEGTHRRLYEQLGAQPLADGGVRFAVWAPSARAVHVVGDFDGWSGETPLRNLPSASAAMSAWRHSAPAWPSPSSRLAATGQCSTATSPEPARAGCRCATTASPSASRSAPMLRARRAARRSSSTDRCRREEPSAQWRLRVHVDIDVRRASEVDGPHDLPEADVERSAGRWVW